jgi:hypothetical protein
VTGVQTCALPILVHYHYETDDPGPLLPAAWKRTIDPVSTT